MLKNTLFVLRLSDNLFSVTQSNESGGMIAFYLDKVRIERLNNDNRQLLCFEVGPPFYKQRRNVGINPTSALSFEVIKNKYAASADAFLAEEEKGQSNTQPSKQYP